MPKGKQYNNMRKNYRYKFKTECESDIGFLRRMLPEAGFEVSLINDDLSDIEVVISTNLDVVAIKELMWCIPESDTMQETLATERLYSGLRTYQTIAVREN